MEGKLIYEILKTALKYIHLLSLYFFWTSLVYHCLSWAAGFQFATCSSAAPLFIPSINLVLALSCGF